MAENKKSFVLYSDSQGLINQLPDEIAGQLLKHIFAYVNDENPQTDNLLLKIAFEPIKMQLKRDLVKYEDKKEQWSEAGKKSAEARRIKKEQELLSVNNYSTNSTNVNSVATVSTVSVNVNDNVNVNDIKDNSINSRKLKFAHTLKPFVDVYGKETIRNFYDYWTEHGENDKKMRYEKEKSFGLNRRLTTWNNNNFNKNNNGKSTITNTDEFKQIVTAIKSDGVRR